MTEIPYRIALIVGAGSAISGVVDGFGHVSASFSRGLAAAGLRVGLSARDAEKLATLIAEIDAETFYTDEPLPAAQASPSYPAYNHCRVTPVLSHTAIT